MVPALSQATGSEKMPLYCQSLATGHFVMPCLAATVASVHAAPAGEMPNRMAGFSSCIILYTSATILFTFSRRQSAIERRLREFL